MASIELLINKLAPAHFDHIKISRMSWEKCWRIESTDNVYANMSILISNLSCFCYHSDKNGIEFIRCNCPACKSYFSIYRVKVKPISFNTNGAFFLRIVTVTHQIWWQNKSFFPQKFCFVIFVHFYPFKNCLKTELIKNLLFCK